MLHIFFVGYVGSSFSLPLLILPFPALVRDVPTEAETFTEPKVSAWTSGFCALFCRSSMLWLLPMWRCATECTFNILGIWSWTCRVQLACQEARLCQWTSCMLPRWLTWKPLCRFWIFNPNILRCPVAIKFKFKFMTCVCTQGQLLLPQ